jgi:hypothetical protein
MIYTCETQANVKRQRSGVLAAPSDLLPIHER